MGLPTVSVRYGPDPSTVIIACFVWQVLLIGALAVLVIAALWGDSDLCYYLETCYSRSLPRVDNFVGREEDVVEISLGILTLAAQMFR